MTTEFAQTLTRLRRAKGLSQEQLAAQMEVSRQAVGKWESGQSMPELEKLIALAELFGVSLDELVRPGAARAGQIDAAGAVRLEAAEGTLSVPAGAALLVAPGYEYKSRLSWHGLPLVHINLGYGRYGFGLRCAKGVIAIGNIAAGVVAVGGLGLGVVSFSGIGIGLLSIGGVALGGLAFGGVALGIVAVGASAIGVYALGACAVASQAAVGTVAQAPVSAGLNTDAGFVITQETSRAQLAQYLCEGCPGMPRPLAWLLSLGGR